MAIHPSGTFNYRGVIPAMAADGSFECDLVQRDGSPEGRLAQGAPDHNRLVGWAPRLVVRDAGLTPNASANRPLVARHSFTLHATDQRASMRTAAFHVESTILQRLQAGDVLHLVHGMGADLGLSILRDDRLIVAAGDIAAVPVGSDLSVTIPWDLARQAEDVYRRYDPEFLPPGMPDGALMPRAIEVRYGNERALVLWWTRNVGPYEVTVLSGAVVACGGGAAKGSICRRGACSLLGAGLTARLMSLPDALSMT